MKKNRLKILAILCTSIFGNALHAQVECVSLNGYTDIYLDFVSTDDNTFPPGTLFISSGGISYMKLGNLDVYQTVNGDTLGYNGDIGIDVSYPQCSSKILVFSVDTLEELTVDDEPVFANGNTIGSYNGMNFSVSHAANQPYTVQGQFDLVKLFSGQNRIYDVCLTCIGAGVDELNHSSILIYPNPVIGRLNLKSSHSVNRCKVFSATGNLIADREPDPITGEVPLPSLVTGHYFLEIELTGNRTERLPFQYIGE